MLKNHHHRFFGLVVIVLCGMLWFFVVPTYVPGEGPAFFPRLAIAWIALFALLTSVFPPTAAAPLPMLEGAPDEGAEQHELAPAVDESGGASVYGLMIVWALYVTAIGYLGFYVSSFLMLTTSMYYLGLRRLPRLLLVPVVALTIIYLLLDVGLNFRLPEAFWQ